MSDLFEQSKQLAELVAQCEPEAPPPKYTGVQSIPRLLGWKDHPPVRCFSWPADADSIKQLYWSVAQASVAWGLPYQSTRRWLWGNLENAVILELSLANGGKRYKLVMPAGQVRTVRGSSGRRGNPAFLDPDYQAALVSRRWVRQRLAARGIDPDGLPWD